MVTAEVARGAVGAVRAEEVAAVGWGTCCHRCTSVWPTREHS